MTHVPFDPGRILRTLHGHGVRHILIGGLAARVWGSPSITVDADICYARDGDNLERLAAALRELGATLRGVHEEVPFQLDARSLRAGDHFTFMTDAGPLDCLAIPSGSGGFAELDRNAIDGELEGVSVRVVDLDDLMRMKRAAGRPKDRIELEVLGALRDELEGRDE